MNEIYQNLGQALSRFYNTALNVLGFLVFSWGLIYSIKKKEVKIYGVLLLCFLAFLLIIFKAGYTFSHHSYYIIPFVPVMALVAAYGLSALSNRLHEYGLLLAVGLIGILNQYHDVIIRPEEKALLSLESKLDSVSTSQGLILINSGRYPTPMYFAHRRGWIASNENIDSVYINELKPKGLSYVVILKESFGSPMKLNLQKVYENKHYLIYSTNN